MPAASQGWVANLRRFAAGRAAGKRCDLCGSMLGEPHPHLIELEKRRLACACRACALLFEDQPDGRFRRIPEAVAALEDFHMSEAQWEALNLPIGMAFFFYNSLEDRVVAFYPGAAGATESLLGLDAWAKLVADNPVLASFEPDAEALLVNRLDGAREYFRVPVDRCYALVGVIRSFWHGFTGGAQARTAIQEFLSELRGACGQRSHG